MTPTAAGSESTAAAPPPPRPQHHRARGLTVWSVIALVLSPFSVPTFGVGVALAIGLIVVSGILQARGFDARRPLAAGIVALVLGVASGGACSWLFLRSAEVTGREAVRQERVEDRFDRAFDRATEAPAADIGPLTGDAGILLDADSAPRPQEP